jgi:hypothetical protein
VLLQVQQMSVLVPVNQPSNSGFVVPSTNSPNKYCITWYAVPANSFAPVTDADLLASSITLLPVPGDSAAGVYTGTLTVKKSGWPV